MKAEELAVKTLEKFQLDCGLLTVFQDETTKKNDNIVDNEMIVMLKDLSNLKHHGDYAEDDQVEKADSVSYQESQEVFDEICLWINEVARQAKTESLDLEYKV